MVEDFDKRYSNKENYNKAAAEKDIDKIIDTTKAYSEKYKGIIEATGSSLNVKAHLLEFYETKRKITRGDKLKAFNFEVFP